MKKRSFLSCLLGLLVLSGCDGSGWSKTIEAQAYPSMNVLELKVRRAAEWGRVSRLWRNQVPVGASAVGDGAARRK